MKNRYRFCTIRLVGLEEKIIDKDFTQSYCLALQFWVQPNRIFYRGSATGIPRKKENPFIREMGAGAGREKCLLD